jgi:hypothetical protein
LHYLPDDDAIYRVARGTETDNPSVGLAVGRDLGIGGTTPAWLADTNAMFAIDTQQRIAGNSSAGADRSDSRRPEVVSGSVRAVLAVLRRWDISNELAARILGGVEADHVARLRSGLSGLRTRDDFDRARLLLDIYEGIFSIFRDPESERSSIRAPRMDLGGRSLLDMMSECSQRNLMRAQAFVDYLNGR